MEEAKALLQQQSSDFGQAKVEEAFTLVINKVGLYTIDGASASNAPSNSKEDPAAGDTILFKDDAFGVLTTLSKPDGKVDDFTLLVYRLKKLKVGARTSSTVGA